jgi:hypothetical protein
MAAYLDYVRAVSAQEHADPAAAGFRAGPSEGRVGAGSRAARLPRMRIAQWSAPAWGAIASATAFIAITCWWLTQDRSIPIYDAGDHLETALVYRGMLASGHIFEPFTSAEIYPILVHMVGAVAALIGGVSVAAPIVGSNVVFVPLLALGCYQTGKLLFGPLAGLLAVVFVFGSPLLISLFHVFMLDAPLTAMVSVSVWLMLASEDFKRPGVCALAGVAVGLGVNVKVQFALFVAVLTLVMLAHGGWRNRRGFAIFTVVALAIGLPWYIEHSSELGEMFELASSGPGTPAGNIPATVSVDNLLWYFWSTLNSQLLAPLWLLAAAGAAWTTVNVARARGGNFVRMEFLLGAFGAWFVVTFVTPHHDIRYGLPLLAYTAVIATGWITRVPRAASIAAIALLAIGVGANTLAIDFGVGGEAKLALASKPPETEQFPDRVVFYSTNGFLASAPSRDGDVPGLLGALHRAGVRTVTWSAEQSALPDFSSAGLSPISRIAGLTPAPAGRLEYASSASVATLIHEAVSSHRPSACTRLSDGTAVWVIRYDEAAGKLSYYCPSRRPQFYAPAGS